MLHKQSTHLRIHQLYLGSSEIKGIQNPPSRHRVFKARRLRLICYAIFFEPSAENLSTVLLYSQPIVEAK